VSALGQRDPINFFSFFHEVKSLSAAVDAEGEEADGQVLGEGGEGGEGGREVSDILLR